MPIANHVSYNMDGKDTNPIKLVAYKRDDDVADRVEVTPPVQETDTQGTVQSENGLSNRLTNSELTKPDQPTDTMRSNLTSNDTLVATLNENDTKESTEIPKRVEEKVQLGNGYDNLGYALTEKNETCQCGNKGNGFVAQSINKNVNGNYTLSMMDIEDDSSWIEEQTRKCCSKKTLYKRLPVLSLFQNYDKDMFVSDLVAGITVGLTMIPQGIAYANVAGLPPKYGLYSAFIGCFFYVIFGSIKDSTIGMTAILAILIRENVHGFGPEFAVLLCFLTGAIQLIMSVLQLGFLIDFISGPVSVGFTSAAAIAIAMTQMKDLLGLSFGASKFMDVWNQITIHFREIRIWDASLGLTCIVILLLLRKVKDIQIGPATTKEKTSFQKSMASFLWFLSTGRNIIVVIVCSMLAYVYKGYTHTDPPFKLSEAVDAGLPKFAPPQFSTQVGNVTYNFFEMTSVLGSGIILVPLLSLLEDTSLAKVFSEGKSVDANQELLALGVCNLLSSFVSSVPLSGGLSRGAINNASGARTTLGSVYVGIIVILSLQFFTQYFSYIPKACLAAVIIAAVIFMIELNVVKPMWKTKKIDLIPAAATFITCLLFRLEIGILIGVSINVIFLLYGSARPTVHVEKRKNDLGYEYIVITPDRSLAFPSVEYVRNVVSKAGLKQGYSSIPVVIDSRHVQGADFTSAKGIKSLIDDFVKRNQLLLFYNLKPSVVDIFRSVEPAEFHHCETEEKLHDFLKAYYFRTLNANEKIKH